MINAKKALQEIYNVGTEVYYEGEVECGLKSGYGKITETLTGILGTYVMTVTLDNGYVMTGLTQEDFEGGVILGNPYQPKLHVIETLEDPAYTPEYDGIFDKGLAEREVYNIAY